MTEGYWKLFFVSHLHVQFAPACNGYDGFFDFTFLSYNFRIQKRENFVVWSREQNNISRNIHCLMLNSLWRPTRKFRPVQKVLIWALYRLSMKTCISIWKNKETCIEQELPWNYNIWRKLWPPLLRLIGNSPVQSSATTHIQF